LLHSKQNVLKNYANVVSLVQIELHQMNI